MPNKAWGAVLVVSVSCFMLSSVVSAAEPIDEPRRPAMLCKRIDNDGMSCIPNPDLPPDPGRPLVVFSEDSRPTISQAEVSQSRKTEITEEIKSPSLTWVVWVDFLINLFN